jgi:DNA-directed RNA polymerase beta subunit
MSEMSLAKQRIRKNFGKIPQIVEIPDLIGVQRESYSRFLQMDIPPNSGKTLGCNPSINRFFRSRTLPVAPPSNLYPTGLPK